MVGDQRQGWAIFAAMGVLFLVGVASPTTPSRAATRPSPRSTSIRRASALQAGGNMEGKEVRFGIANSALFATATTDTSCGAVNSMHDSFMPLGGMVPLVNIMLGEIIFGGVGSGLYGMLVFAIIAMFIAGLMVGRTPEYLGKKSTKEVKMTMLAILILPLSILGFTAMAVGGSGGTRRHVECRPARLQRNALRLHLGDRQQRQRLRRAQRQYGLLQYDLAFAMMIGRFLMVIPLLAVAGSLVQKKLLAPSAGTFPTTGPLFVGLLVGVIVIIGGLTYFPALALGPVVSIWDACPYSRSISGNSPMETVRKTARRRSRCSISRYVVPAIGDSFQRSSTRAPWRATRSCSWSRSFGAHQRSSSGVTSSPGAAT